MDRILIVDDHPLVRNAIRALLASAFPECGLEEASSLQEAIAYLSGDPECDLVTLDLDLPDARQLEALSSLHARFPSVPVAILSGSKDPALKRAAMAGGAAGFISKLQRPDILVAALREIRAGGSYADAPMTNAEADEDQAALNRVASLTPQQRAVFSRIVEGRLNKQIAHDLDISLTTVKAHVSAVLAKLGVANRTQATILANRLQLFS